jgi:hypothetical protein
MTNGNTIVLPLPVPPGPVAPAVKATFFKASNQNKREKINVVLIQLINS